MKKLFTTALALLLILVPELSFPVEDYANAKYKVLSAASCIYPTKNMIKQFDRFDGFSYPDNERFFTIRHIGEPGSIELANEIENVVTWDVGQYTGFSIPYSMRRFFQRGYQNDADVGTPAFQLHCKTAGFLINTFQFEHYSGTIECPVGYPDCQGGPHAVLYEEFGENGPLIFRTPSSELTLQVYAKLPWVHWEEKPAVAQQYMLAYLIDQTTGSRIAWLASFYDSRPFGRGNGNKLTADDGVTSFVSAPISTTLANGEPNPYVTKSPYSAAMANGTSWGASERFYRAHLKRGQFVDILLDVNLNRLNLGQVLVSENPDDWRLNAIGIAVEIGWPDGPSSEISVGGSWRYFEAYEAYEE